MNIEIVTTPNSALNETGFGSLQACQNVLDSVLKMGHQCLLSSCKSLEDLEGVLTRKPDLVVIAVKFIPIENNENVWLPEYFENNNIAYTGSSKNILMYDSDKVLAKQYLKENGVSTALFFTAYENEFQSNKELPLEYPLFLKPICAANSNGVDEHSYVSSFDEFERKVLSLKNNFNQTSLVEEYLDGAEYTVAILTAKNGELLISAVEVEPPELNQGRRILSKDTKYENNEVLKVITDPQISYEVRRIAVEVFTKIGAEGFARIDIKSNKSGKCFFMEINLVPGMTMGTSYFPEAFRIDQGHDYDQTIVNLIDYCLFKTMQKQPLIEQVAMEFSSN